MNQQSLHHCQVCDEWQAEGIYVLMTFICKSCERTIVQTSPDDELYQQLVERMKCRPLMKQM
ncbi:putative methyltransferase [Alkalibacillus flavidus]|uniref:Methyltransferase n=1 Tax=Alkalibacillus flavidus TaxID=546021 RepID=A0ABV2KYY6_9BACI